MKPPAFQFYPDDFIGGTVTMSHDERGLYILLLCVQWSKGHLTDDDFERLGRGLAEPSLNHVRTKFNRGSTGLWTNHRLEEERDKQNQYREQQRAKGLRSAEQRFNRGSTVVQPKGEPEGNSPSPSPISDSISNSKDISQSKRSKFEIPTRDEMNLHAAKLGLPEVEVAKFEAFYESKGWMVGKNRMASWRGAMAGWKVRWESNRPGQSNGHTNGATSVILGKELERVIARMKVLRDTYGDHQTWTDQDVAEFNKLKERRNELRKTLGVQA